MTTTGPATGGRGFRTRAIRIVNGTRCFRCTICGEWMPPERFPLYKDRPSGRRSACRPCHYKRDREHKRRRKAERTGIEPKPASMVKRGKEPLPLPREEIANRYATGRETLMEVGDAYGVSGQLVMQITRRVFGDRYDAVIQVKRAKRRKRRDPPPDPRPVKLPAEAKYLPTPEDVAARTRAIREQHLREMSAIPNTRVKVVD